MASDGNLGDFEPSGSSGDDAEAKAREIYDEMIDAIPADELGDTDPAAVADAAATAARAELGLDEPAGAIDQDYDDAVQLGPGESVPTEPMAGGVALDLVTRQPLFIRRVVADDLREYYDEEGFDLLAYKTHPYLPVREDDTVYEVVYITNDPERLHKPGKTYDMPRGRLAHIPVEQAWMEGED